jgi:excisionase family DNA binding protein
MPAFARPLESHLPSETEQAVANQLRQILAAQSAGGAAPSLRFLDGQKQPAEIVLTPGLSQLLMELLRHIGRGNAVTLLPVGQMLTTQQAADLLNVSRPHLISLLEKGELEHSLVGRHRRIRAEHLFAYQRRRDARRDKALSTLAELDAELL